MRFRIFTEPQQGATYDTQLRMAQAAEQLGFEAWIRSDHYMAMGDGDGLPGPTDAWTTLAGLARETSTIRLGTLVSSATHRHPAILAIQAAQVDAMSGGRVEFGLGTGWFEAEHRALGIPFPDKRFDLLEEQLRIITGLWATPSGETFSFAGDSYQLAESPALPKPVQPTMPVIIGGNGPRRTPAIAARFATEFNIGFIGVAESQRAFVRAREAAEAIGRDPQTLGLSVAKPTIVGRTEAEARERAARSGQDLDELRATQLGGTPGELVEAIGRYAEIGADTVYLQLMDMSDLDHLELLAAEVVSQF